MNLNFEQHQWFWNCFNLHLMWWIKSIIYKPSFFAPLPLQLMKKLRIFTKRPATLRPLLKSLSKIFSYQNKNTYLDRVSSSNDAFEIFCLCFLIFFSFGRFWVFPFLKKAKFSTHSMGLLVAVCETVEKQTYRPLLRREKEWNATAPSQCASRRTEGLPKFRNVKCRGISLSAYFFDRRRTAYIWHSASATKSHWLVKCSTTPWIMSIDKFAKYFRIFAMRKYLAEPNGK